mmetsp:Transcript_5906/g.17633  ORF Transcript_5906/g.17633 Transcript_5906/m.17633 type:complete len:219 (-) Transcript_5906:794-1450(-)
MSCATCRASRCARRSGVSPSTSSSRLDTAGGKEGSSLPCARWNNCATLSWTCLSGPAAEALASAGAAAAPAEGSALPSIDRMERPAELVAAPGSGLLLGAASSAAGACDGMLGPAGTSGGSEGLEVPVGCAEAAGCRLPGGAAQGGSPPEAPVGGLLELNHLPKPREARETSSSSSSSSAKSEEPSRAPSTLKGSSLSRCLGTSSTGSDLPPARREAL